MVFIIFRLLYVLLRGLGSMPFCSPAKIHEENGCGLFRGLQFCNPSSVMVVVDLSIVSLVFESAATGTPEANPCTTYREPVSRLWLKQRNMQLALLDNSSELAAAY
jgi:hypothetical protein